MEMAIDPTQAKTMQTPQLPPPLLRASLISTLRYRAQTDFDEQMGREGQSLSVYLKQPWYGSGASEERLGRAIRAIPESSKVRVTTKTGRLFREADGTPAGPGFDTMV